MDRCCIYCQSILERDGIYLLCPICPNVKYSHSSITFVVIETTINESKYYIMFHRDSSHAPILTWGDSHGKSHGFMFIPLAITKTITPQNVQQKIKTILLFR